MRTLIAALLAVIAVAVGYLAWDAYRDEARADEAACRETLKNNQEASRVRELRADELEASRRCIRRVYEPA